jgi:hypothetical protein
MPALSPVAWASFITGQTPGGHGIGDFIARDPATHMPVFSIFENRAPRLAIDFGDLHLPLVGGGATCLRRGKPFWAYLTERGIPAWVFQGPDELPVEETATRPSRAWGRPTRRLLRVRSATTRRIAWAHGDISSGTVPRGVRTTGWTPSCSGRSARSWRLKDAQGSGRIEVSAPFTVHLDPDRAAVLIRIGGRALVLEQGEYSDW